MLQGGFQAETFSGSPSKKPAGVKIGDPATLIKTTKREARGGGICPEIAGLAYWLYERESDLLTREGTTLKSSNGVHQGCGLANLFGLLIYHINARLTPKVSISGVRFPRKPEFSDGEPLGKPEFSTRFPLQYGFPKKWIFLVFSRQRGKPE